MSGQVACHTSVMPLGHLLSEWKKLSSLDGRWVADIAWWIMPWWQYSNGGDPYFICIWGHEMPSSCTPKWWQAYGQQVEPRQMATATWKVLLSMCRPSEEMGMTFSHVPDFFAVVARRWVCHCIGGMFGRNCRSILGLHQCESAPNRAQATYCTALHVVYVAVKDRNQGLHSCNF